MIKRCMQESMYRTKDNVTVHPLSERVTKTEKTKENERMITLPERHTELSGSSTGHGASSTVVDVLCEPIRPTISMDIRRRNLMGGRCPST